LLLIAFIGIPIIEIAGFITLGSWIGLWWTLGTVLLTAIVGTALVRSQSTSVLARINEQLAVGEIPARALFDGLCLLAAALLLLTPGFFTDAIGIALLLPPVRALIAPLLLRWAQRRGNLSFAGMGGGGSGLGGMTSQMSEEQMRQMARAIAGAGATPGDGGAASAIPAS
ncbi:MAG: FxsA family protein, partial [Pseudomonadota bacterium]|nr:FxsA family protein [Pseudomonadota bacterium]